MQVGISQVGSNKESKMQGVVEPVFYTFGLLMFLVVAFRPVWFIRGLTLGMYGESDVNKTVLMVTRVIAGLSAVVLTIWLAFE
jgi:hypothetical protein